MLNRDSAIMMHLRRAVPLSAKRLVLHVIRSLGYWNATPDPTSIQAALVAVADAAGHEEQGPAGFQKVLAHLQGDHRRNAQAIYDAISELEKEGVAGDIVDCGDGAVDVRIVAAATLNELGQLDRKLISYDVTLNPTLRSEPELTLWGSQFDPLDRPPPCRAQGGKAASETHVVVSLGATIHVFRAPRENYDGSGDIALLVVATDNYPANQTAIRNLVCSLRREDLWWQKGCGPAPDVATRSPMRCTK